jgi:nucleoside-diphosphate-sugar epimerase
MLLQAGHEVVGLDSFLFAECTFGQAPPEIPAIRLDVRDVGPEALDGFDAVIALAALSNDPLGDLNPAVTYDINHRGTVNLAIAAKAAGVPRLLFSSSCSLYGAQGDAPIDESGSFFPVTPYGESKVFAERDLSALADDRFSPVYLRNATAYGMSPRLRGDLVVNNLVAWAMTTGEVRMTSDGSPWRPLVHIEDIARAFLALLDAPQDLVHDRAFNVGRTEENYRIREVARLVEDVVPGSTITFAEGAGPDKRNYRVSCERIETEVPGFQPVWTVRKGIEELYDAFVSNGLTVEVLGSWRLQRIAWIRQLIAEGRLGTDLRWRSA